MFHVLLQQFKLSAVYGINQFFIAPDRPLLGGSTLLLNFLLSALRHYAVVKESRKNEIAVVPWPELNEKFPY